LTSPCFYGIIAVPLQKGFFFVPYAQKDTAFSEGGTQTALQSNKFEMGGAEIMANDARVKVTLVCTECKQRNYDTKKNKKNDPDRLELNKYCKFCRKHTLHKESK